MREHSVLPNRICCWKPGGAESNEIKRLVTRLAFLFFRLQRLIFLSFFISFFLGRGSIIARICSMVVAAILLLLSPWNCTYPTKIAVFEKIIKETHKNFSDLSEGVS